MVTDVTHLTSPSIGTAVSSAMSSRPTVDEETALLLRGTAEETPKGSIRAKVELARKENRPLRIKFGVDPTAPDLHLGHTVPLRKLKQFQDLGHTVIFLIGDFTTRIGDPTGRSVTRPALTPEQIEANTKTYLDQVWRILDREKTEVAYNSRWSAPMTFADVIKLASKYTVAQLLERDDFAKRYKSGQPIAVHEFLYPLVQGYDSVALKADVELCATDQIFNCLVARVLQQDAGQPPEAILAMPLLEGTDGVKKMSKSVPEHAIGVEDPPADMYGKLLSIPDAMIERYATLLLSDPLPAGLPPRDAKHALARAVVTAYAGADAAARAAEHFERVVVRGEAPTDVKTLDLRSEMTSEYMDVSDLLIRSGLVTSRNEVRNLLRAGAIEIDGRPPVPVQVQGVTLRRADFRSPIRDGATIQVGKRRFVKVQTDFKPLVMPLQGSFTWEHFVKGCYVATGGIQERKAGLVCWVSAVQFGNVMTWNSEKNMDLDALAMVARVNFAPPVEIRGAFLIPEDEMWWSPRTWVSSFKPEER